MNERKFLTVMAVFDPQTQEKLSSIQKYLINNISCGTQTIGIPFHITLGSYPVDELVSVISKINQVAATAKSFDIQLKGYNHFGNRVFFLEPEIIYDLVKLRKSFECDYANGFDWVPHATLYCGEFDEVEKANMIVPKNNLPIKARIVGIELGEFFPPNKKYSVNFKE